MYNHTRLAIILALLLIYDILISRIVFRKYNPIAMVVTAIVIGFAILLYGLDST